MSPPAEGKFGSQWLSQHEAAALPICDHSVAALRLHAPGHSLATPGVHYTVKAQVKKKSSVLAVIEQEKAHTLQSIQQTLCCYTTTEKNQLCVHCFHMGFKLGENHFKEPLNVCV